MFLSLHIIFFLFFTLSRYMHFDIESALAIVGGEALDEALKQAKAQNITLDVNYNKTESKITYCLHNFYKKIDRRKRSLLEHYQLDEERGENKILHNTGEIYLQNDNSDEENESKRTGNKVIARKLLSIAASADPSFEDVENEVLANDVVSKALGTDVCRYCVSKCPEK